MAKEIIAVASVSGCDSKGPTRSSAPASAKLLHMYRYTKMCVVIPMREWMVVSHLLHVLDITLSMLMIRDIGMCKERRRQYGHSALSGDFK